jgi:hypothetical protein
MKGTLVIACGALASELKDVITRNRLQTLAVEYLPASLHNYPDRIPAAVADRIGRAREQYDHIFVAYGDCGTGGQLDRLLEGEGIERLPGAHCYQFFATSPLFNEIQEAEPGTFYLTDFLARHFERLVMRGLGLDKHPELYAMYFGNYRRVVHLAQTEDQAAEEAGRRAAATLGLAYERIIVGYGDLQTSLIRLESAVCDA